MTTIRTLILLFACFLPLCTLSACGFAPVYGTYAKKESESVKTELGNIHIDNIPDRTGQRLRNLLIDRMAEDQKGQTNTATYRLSIDAIEEVIYGVGVAKDATATRSQIKLTTKFRLFDTRSGAKKQILQREIRAVSSFNTLASQYTTLVTKEDARSQTIEQLADRIVTQLELYFSNPQAFEPQQ